MPRTAEDTAAGMPGATRRRARNTFRTLAVGSAALATVVAAATQTPPARGDAGPLPHHVVYDVTAAQAADVGIYYHDIDPPTWSDYSHNPYEFSPRDDVRLQPGRHWVRDVTLTDPDQWAMVTVTTAGQPSQPGQTLHCRLTVDGVVVDQADGPRGALCSLRHW